MLSDLIWLIENSFVDTGVPAVGVLCWVHLFVHLLCGQNTRNAWDGAGSGEEAPTCFLELSVQTWEAGRQERRQQEYFYSAHVILNKSFFLVL